MKLHKRDISLREIIILLLAAVVLLLFASRNSPFYQFNVYADVNCFFSVGKAMMNGIIPYLDIYEQKGPLLYFLYGLAYLISNKSFIGVYILEIIALFSAMLGIRKIVEIYVKKPIIGLEIFAAALFLSSRSYGSGGNSAEEYCLPMFIWAIYGFLKVSAEPSQKHRIYIYIMELWQGRSCL